MMNDQLQTIKPRLYAYRSLIIAVLCIAAAILCIPLPTQMIAISLLFAYIFAGMTECVYKLSQYKLTWNMSASLILLSIGLFIYTLIKQSVISIGILIRYILSVMTNPTYHFQPLMDMYTKQIVPLLDQYANRLSEVNYYDVLNDLNYIFKQQSTYMQIMLPNVSNHNGAVFYVSTFIAIVIFASLLFCWKNIDNYFNNLEKFYYTDENIRLYQFDMLNVMKQMHNSIKHWAITIVQVGAIMFIIYYVMLMSFGVSNAMLCSIMYGFSGIIPFMGEFLAWSIMTLSILCSGLSFVKICVCCALLWLTNIVAGNAIMAYFVGNRLQINIVYLAIGLLININLFGFLGFIYNTPLCIFTKIIIDEIYKTESSINDTANNKPDRNTLRMTQD
jgi:predicted PurR-regulated permease PerM